jgi:hypothetical protein
MLTAARDDWLHAVRTLVLVVVVIAAARERGATRHCHAVILVVPDTGDLAVV